MTRRTLRDLAQILLAFVAVMAAFAPFWVLAIAGAIRGAR